MKVRVIANCPVDEDTPDISEFIGREFEAEDYLKNEVYIREIDMVLFKGEFEIIN